MTTNQAPKGTVLTDEQIAKTLAEEFASWTKWDTATNVCDTPSGNEPDEERTYWLELVARTRALLSAQPASAPLQDEDAKPKRTKENTLSDLTVAVAESIAKEAHRYRAKKAIDRKGMEQSPAFIGASKKDKKMMLDAWDMSYDYTIDAAIQAQGAKQI